MSFPTTKIIDFCFVTDFVANGSFESLRNNVKYLDGDGFAILVRITDFSKKWKGGFKYVSESAYKFLRHSYLIENDLIMSNVGEPGKVFLLPNLGQPMTLGPNSILIRPDKLKAIEKYLYYYFLSNLGQEKIDSITSGTTQKKFNKTSFRNLAIPLPSLAIQQKIVAKLDAIFTEIDTATAAAEANANNAEALFQSYLNEVFERGGEGWITEKLENLCDNYKQDIVDGPFGSELKSDDYIESGIPVLKIQNIKPFNIILKKMDYVSDTKYEYLKRHSYTNGDIIMTKLGNPLGVSAIVKDLKNGVIVADLVRIRAKKINTEYLCYFLNSNKTSSYINEQQKGTTRPRVRLSVVREIPIKYPPIDKQNEVVYKIKNFLFEIDKSDLAPEKRTS